MNNILDELKKGVLPAFLSFELSTLNNQLETCYEDYGDFLSSLPEDDQNSFWGQVATSWWCQLGGIMASSNPLMTPEELKKNIWKIKHLPGDGNILTYPINPATQP